MEAGAGLSTDLVAEAAARGAARAAMGRLGRVNASLAVVFASTHYQEKYSSLVSVVRAVTGTPQLIGCSASGVLSPDGEYEDLPAVVVLAVHGAELLPMAFMTPGSGPGGADTHALARALKAEVDEDGVLMLFPDARAEPPAATMRAIEEELGYRPIIGGDAPGDSRRRAGAKFCGAAVAEAALAGMHLKGAGRVLVGVTQGCIPVGRPFVVTKAEGHVIREIASVPATDVLARALAELAPQPGPQELLLGVAHNPGKFPLGLGDFVIRHMVRLDASEKAIAVSEPVAVGETVQFHRLDATAARQDLLVMLTRLKVRLGRAAPRWGLYVNCAGRGQRLFGSLHHDVSLIRDMLGEFPLAGFFSHAGLAPVNDVNHVHRYAGVLTLFI